MAYTTTGGTGGLSVGTINVETTRERIVDWLNHHPGETFTMDVLMNAPGTAAGLAKDILTQVAIAIEARNTTAPKGAKAKAPADLPAESIAAIFAATGNWRLISIADEDSDGAQDWTLGVQKPGDGIYTLIDSRDATTSPAFLTAIKALNPAATRNTATETYNSLVAMLAQGGAMGHVNTDKKIVYTATGVYDYHRRADGLDPWTTYDDPEFVNRYADIIRIAKLDTGYNANAQDPTYTAPDGWTWNVQQHITAPYASDWAAKLWLEIAHFAVRGSSGGVMWYFLNASANKDGNMSGGNGKSGQIGLLRNVIGTKNTTDTGVRHIVDDIRNSRSKIIGKMAILSNEETMHINSVKESDEYKRLVRGEALNIRRLYHDPIDYVYDGAVVQCMNGDRILIADNSEAAWRNVGILRFEKHFATATSDPHKCVNDEFIKTREAREYFLKILLEMDCLETYTPEYMAHIREDIDEIRVNSNPIETFCAEVVTKLTVPFCPYAVIWPVFRQWQLEQGLHYEYDFNQFKSGVRTWCDAHNWTQVTKRFPTAGVPEETVVEYYLRARGDIQAQLNLWVATRNGKIPGVNNVKISDYVIKAPKSAPMRGIIRADVDAATKTQQTPQQIAAANDPADFRAYVEMLMKYGDVDAMEKIIKAAAPDAVEAVLSWTDYKTTQAGPAGNL